MTEDIEMPPSSPRLDRRARNRARTRDALIRSAMALFSAQGYDATTIEQITDLADVSSRTFFRYFPSKEAVLYEEEGTAVVEYLTGQPKELSDLEAVLGALVEVSPYQELLRERMRLFLQARETSMVLAGADLRQREATEEKLARGLADRRSLGEPDDDARLAAALGMTLLRSAMLLWLRSDDPLPLVEYVLSESRRLTGLVSTLPGTPPTGPSPRKPSPTKSSPTGKEAEG